MAADETQTANAARTPRKVCHRYRVESASTLLGMGHLWPEARRRETLARVRRLPTYDPKTDTVEVCRYVF